MNEQSVASAKASVMVYDNANKKWVDSGSSSGLSKVHLYQHTVNNTFRVVGRKLQDHEVVINCAILKGLRYNQATPTFHQWRDNRQVYGLNFTNKDDAENFATAMTRALEILGQNNSVNHNRASYQTESNYQMTGPGGISLDEYAEYRGGRMNSENNSWKATTPEYATYATATVNSSSHPTTPGSASSPSAYGHHRTSSAPLNPQPLSASQQPSYQVTSPPPPPPPPPTGNLSGSVTLPRQSTKSSIVQGPSPVSLASALATAKLKKTPATKAGEVTNSDNRLPPAIGSMASMMDEMTRTLARRRAQAENQDRESIGSNDSGKTSQLLCGNSSPNKNAGSESPQSSQRSQSDGDGESRNHIIDHSDLERMKQEIVSEMKKEINRVKQEIIDAIRMEPSRR